MPALRPVHDTARRSSSAPRSRGRSCSRGRLPRLWSRGDDYRRWGVESRPPHQKQKVRFPKELNFRHHLARCPARRFPARSRTCVLLRRLCRSTSAMSVSLVVRDDHGGEVPVRVAALRERAPGGHHEAGEPLSASAARPKRAGRRGIRAAKRHARRPWLVQLLARRTIKVATVARANKRPGSVLSRWRSCPSRSCASRRPYLSWSP
jgi:hypothetical protein